MQVGDHVGPGGDEHLVAALEGGAAEVVGSQVAQLQVGPDGSVEHHHPLAHRFQVRTHQPMPASNGTAGAGQLAKDITRQAGSAALPDSAYWAVRPEGQGRRRPGASADPPAAPRRSRPAVTAGPSPGDAISVRVETSSVAVVPDADLPSHGHKGHM